MSTGLHLHSISEHKPHKTLPTYALRKNIILLGAYIDFKYAEKKKFDAVSDRNTQWFAPGTLGDHLYTNFDQQGYHLIKNKEVHDIMHVLFDYDKDAEWEALLQAFLLWNRAVGDYTYPFLLANVLLLPETISNIYAEYQKWKQYINVREFDFFSHLGTQKEELLSILKK